MSIVSTRETTDSTGSSRTGGEWDYVRSYIVQVDSTDDSPRDVRLDSGTPQIGDAHPEDSLATVRTVNVRYEGDSPFVFIVEVFYSSLVSPDDPGTDPFARLADVTWSSVQSQEVVEKATRYTAIGPEAASQAVPAFDVPVTNSAFDLRATVRDISYPVLQLTRNEQNFDPLTIVQYQDTVNSGGFNVPGRLQLLPDGTYGYIALAIAPREARMMSIGATKVSEAGQTFYQVTYVLQFRPSWRLEILDEGNRALLDNPKYTDASGSEPKYHHVSLSDLFQKDMPDKMRLNGFGAVEVPNEDGTVDATYLTYGIYDERDFSIFAFA